jgi:Polyphosphate kinase 2 (PPK2)
VPPGKDFKLGNRQTTIKPFYKSGKHYKRLLEEDVEELSDLQQLHYASNRYALLLIFQGMDSAGKDGAVRHVTSGVDPQGCEVFSFKQPRGSTSLHRSPPAAFGLTFSPVRMPLRFASFGSITLQRGAVIRGGNASSLPHLNSRNARDTQFSLRISFLAQQDSTPMIWITSRKSVPGIDGGFHAAPAWSFHRWSSTPFTRSHSITDSCPRTPVARL